MATPAPCENILLPDRFVPLAAELGRTAPGRTFDRYQNGRAVFYANGAIGTVSGNRIYDYQKNGVVATGQGTAVQVLNNTVTGRGHLTTIAQNGVVILSRRLG